jgi:hypothetical protein
LSAIATVGGTIVAVTTIPAATVVRGLGLPAGTPQQRLPGLMLAASGPVALLVGWAYRLVTMAYLDPDPPGLTKWTVWPILPAALAALVLGGVALARPDAGLAVLGRLAFPVHAVAMAATGAVAFLQAHHVEVQSQYLWILHAAIRCGAGLVAAAAVTVFLAGLRPLVIGAVAAPVAVFGALVADLNSIGAIAALFLVATGWWWLGRAGYAGLAILRQPSPPRPARWLPPPDTQVPVPGSWPVAVADADHAARHTEPHPGRPV